MSQSRLRRQVVCVSVSEILPKINDKKSSLHQLLLLCLTVRAQEICQEVNAQSAGFDIVNSGLNLHDNFISV